MSAHWAQTIELPHVNHSNSTTGSPYAFTNRSAQTCKAPKFQQQYGGRILLQLDALYIHFQADRPYLLTYNTFTSMRMTSSKDNQLQREHIKNGSKHENLCDFVQGSDPHKKVTCKSPQLTHCSNALCCCWQLAQCIRLHPQVKSTNENVSEKT